jgi:N-acylneuraminate cytidylyltransferase
MKYKNVALIPLRGGSKSIPLKNIKLINNKPLCQWVIEAAINTKGIDKVFISTDSLLIKDTINSLNLNAEIIDRPSEYATDEATTESVMLHFNKLVNFENLITIQATSPLLTNEDLESALNIFILNKYDSLLSAVKSYRFYWDTNNNPLNYNPSVRPRRQDFEGTFVENGAFYITTRNTLEKFNCRLGGQIGIFEMNEDTFYEIDEPSDWEIVEKKLKNYNNDN